MTPGDIDLGIKTDGGLTNVISIVPMDDIQLFSFNSSTTVHRSRSRPKSDSAYPTRMRRKAAESILLFLFATTCCLQMHTSFALAGLQEPPKTISLITGASGYLGRAIAHTLLEQQHSSDDQEILCLVRSSRVAEEQKYWKSVSCVSVKSYDMLDGGTTLKEALDSCAGGGGNICVYHVASWFAPSDDHVQRAKENVQGTEDVVQVLSKFPKSKLILTSSMAAVRATSQEPGNGKYYTENDWNTESKLGDNWGSSYQWSKAQSERRAWDLSQELKVPMVSLCPSFVFGPPYSDSLSTSFSIELVGKWATGESQVQSRLFVDIRDAARAHVAAGKDPKAIGNRYILSTEKRLPSKDVADLLKNICKELHFGDPETISNDAEFTVGFIPVGQKEVEAARRLQDELGVSLRPAEETIVDMAKFLINISKKTAHTVEKNA